MFNNNISHIEQTSATSAQKASKGAFFLLA